jgi:F-type H+-transporting ATPase subunit alpha
VAVIFAGTGGYLDPLAVDRVGAFEAGLLAHLRSKHANILEEIRKTGELSDETRKKLTAAVETFAKSFT